MWKYTKEGLTKFSNIICIIYTIYNIQYNMWKYINEGPTKFSGITSSKPFGSNIKFNSGNTRTVYKKWSKALNNASFRW